MKLISRRTLTKTIVGLFAFIPAAKGLAGQDQPLTLPQSIGVESIKIPPPPRTAEVFLNFTYGIVEIAKPREITITTSNHNRNVLRLSSESQVWKGKWDRSISLEVGDEVRAWGHPNTIEGTLEVEKMWVNIVNLHGPVINLKKGPEEWQIQHQDIRMGKKLVKINQQTLLNSPNNDEITFGQKGENLAFLQEGQQVQIIGLKLKDESVLATRILL